MFWLDKKVLVTGATGLLGSWMVERLLAESAYVVCLVQDWNPLSQLIQSQSIKKVCVVQGSLENYHDVERAINLHEIEIVIHLGAQTIVGTAFRSPMHTLNANVLGTVNVLEACRVHRNLVQKVLVASSDKAYGTQASLPYSEDMPLQGESPYDVSKSCADLISVSYAKTYDLPVLITRCGNIFGGGDLNWSRLIPGTIRSFHYGQRPVIRSDGQYLRDFIYVEDVVDAYLTLLEAETIKETSFNIGPNKPYSVLEVVAQIQELMNAFHIEPRIMNLASHEIKNQYLSSERMKRCTGWEPKFLLKDGLEETIKWYSSFLETTQQQVEVLGT